LIGSDPIHLNASRIDFCTCSGAATENGGSVQDALFIERMSGRPSPASGVPAAWGILALVRIDVTD
jgi:hypothetical protein